MIALTGITYRQLDHWTNAGYLQAIGHGQGSGRHREWKRSELAVAKRIQRLVKAGFVLAVAADLARKDNGEYELVTGVSVAVDLPA